MTPAQTNGTTTVHPHGAKNGSGGSALPTLVVFGFIVTLLFFLFMLYFWNNDVFRKLLRCAWIQRCCDRFDAWQDEVIYRRPSRRSQSDDESRTNSVSSYVLLSPASDGGFDNPALTEAVDSVDDWATTSVFYATSDETADTERRDSQQLLIEFAGAAPTRCGSGHAESGETRCTKRAAPQPRLLAASSDPVTQINVPS